MIAHPYSFFFESRSSIWETKNMDLYLKEKNFAVLKEKIKSDIVYNLLKS